jgi:hypothetical protein
LANQNYYHSFLSSTDIGVSKVLKKYSSRGNGTAWENTAHNKDAVLELINNIYKLSPRNNPSTKRGATISPHTLSPKSLASFTENDLAVLKNENINVYDIILKLYSDKSSIFEKSAINKQLIMYLILTEAASPKAQIYKKWINPKNSQKEPFPRSNTSHF